MSSVTLLFVAVTASARLSLMTTTPSLSTPVITLQETSVPTALPQPSSSSRNTDESFPTMTVGIATGVGGGSLLAMFIVLVIIAVFLLIRRSRRKGKYSLSASQDHHVVDNPLYDNQGKNCFLAIAVAH